MLAIIQAGGAGTRLKEISGDLPKPMVALEGKPIIEWQIRNLLKNGVKEFIVVIGKNGESIPNYLGDGSWLGARISYLKEEEPLGTGGALALIRDLRDEDFVFCFGDLMFDISWQRMIDFHREKKAKITAFAHPNSHPFDSDILIVNEDNQIIKIDSKSNVRDYYYPNLTNAGLYICHKSVLDFVKKAEKIDFEKVILAHFVNEGKSYAYRSSEYVKDCGTPERYRSVIDDLKNGIIADKSLANLQRAIFLDRDGTINVFGDFVRKSEQLRLKEGVAEAIQKINRSRYLAICVTNQPVIARGETTFTELEKIHDRMEDLLGEGGAYLDDIYFCPHHPDKGFPGEVKELKIDCDCRKPKIGLLLKAKEKYHIDLKKSWFVGDTKQDIQTGINASCRTILLTSGDPNYNAKYREAKPDFICASLNEAVDIIMKSE